MKFAIVLLAVLGLAYSDTDCSAKSPNLEDEFKKFEALIPTQKIVAIAVTYLANDEQVQAFFKYLQGETFAKVVGIVNSQPEFTKLYTFLCANGVPIYKDLDAVNDWLGLPHVTPAPSSAVSPSTRTFRQFLDDVEKVLPIDKLEDLFKQEEKSSTVFKEFVDFISSKEFRAAVDKMIALPEVQQLKADLLKLGAKIEWLENLVRELLGWPKN